MSAGATGDLLLQREGVWSDAPSLSVLGVLGCHRALEFGEPFIIAVFMGIIAPTGGGVIRDILTDNLP